MNYESILLVTCADASSSAFGTAFFIGRDASSNAYAVTCAHVVRDVGGATAVNVGGRPAQVVALGEHSGANDIAVLRVDLPEHLRPLPLGQAHLHRRQCTVVGYRILREQIREARPISGSFTGARLSSHGDPIDAWDLEMAEMLQAGYSGSPVIDRTTGTVIGVTSLGFLNGTRAVAIHISEVSRLWPQVADLQAPRVTRRGIEFVYVAGGSFPMGSHLTHVRQLAEASHHSMYLHEVPQSEVEVDDFHIARYPITNEQYKVYIDETHESVPYRRDDPWSAKYSWDPVLRTYPDGLDRHPVTLVSWFDAQRFSRWLGGRLPTEAEWEKSARGADGRAWPWGNEWDGERCNTVESPSEGTTAVDAHAGRGASSYGTEDMSGNVWEWCSSVSDPYPYHVDDGREDPSMHGLRALRGGAFEANRWMARCAARNAAPGEEFGFTVGFRVVLPASTTHRGLHDY